jgi:hypothetical protein
MATGFEAVGAQPKNPSRGKPIHIARMETGLFTNRSPLHDPATFIVSKFYGGYVDALIAGSNMEVSNQLTLIRRPGSSQWSNQTVAAQPNWFYDWRTLDCGIKVVVDTPTSTYIQTPTTQTTIFTKSPGAGQGYYQGVGDTLYYGDGVDLQKVILQPPGCAVIGPFNWGIAFPTAPAVMTVTPTASATVAWQANTVFSTMGLLVDSTGNIEQLVSVNANPVLYPNATQFGLSGTGEPAWNQTPGGTTLDNGWNWTNWGPIVLWTANTVYNNQAIGGTLANPAIIYDPATKVCFSNTNPGNAQGTSGPTRPNFNSASGAITFDPNGSNAPPGVKWVSHGTVPQSWQPTHVYTNFATGGLATQVVEPVSLVGGFPTNQTIYWQINHTGANQTSGAAGVSPPWSATLATNNVAPYGTTTTDKQLQWLNLGSATRQTNHSYTAWTAQGTPFNVIVDSNNNYQACVVGGVSSATATGSVPWQTLYGQQTNDGIVTWVCLGAKMTWTANTIWHLPTAGWFPPSGSVSFGGSIIIDSNNNEQAVVISGKSGAVHPVWATSPPNALTTDNAATWQLIGPAITQGFVITKGVSFAYSYESRTACDQYNYPIGSVIAVCPNTTWAGAPPDWPSALGAPTGSMTGGISTASPLSTITGATPSSVVTLVIPGSLDPQVDTIVVWATLDGGSQLFFLTEVPNTPPIGGVQQFQTVTINQSPFTGTGSVNQLIDAPIAGQNNPPPAGFKPMAYHFERIWGAVGNFVFASGGPDTLAGNPNESFNPNDFFQFPEPVVRIVPTATGILVFLTSDVYAILGGPVFSTFFPTPMVPGVGLLHYNALDIHGGMIYLFTADNQFIAMDPSGGAQRMGGPIADKLALFDATKVFVTVHESGNDNAIFVGDGLTGWYRLNPAQFPNGNPVWSPFATITGGAGAVLSIEVSPGVHRLLIGGIGANTFILQRDFSTYQDNGTSYTCGFTMGSINLVSPGQIAGLTFVNLRATRTGTTPGCSFLLNEVSGSFTSFPQAQAYPWQIYGATLQPTSIFSNAYYFRAAGVPALAEHMQVQVNFPAENFANEVLSLTVYGVIEQPPEE